MTPETNSTAYILPGIEDIPMAVCTVYNRWDKTFYLREKVIVKPAEVTRKTRLQEYVECRRIIMTLSMILQNKTSSVAGGTVNKKHCMALHHKEKFKQFMETDVSYAKMIREILDRLDTNDEKRIELVQQLGYPKHYRLLLK